MDIRYEGNALHKRYPWFGKPAAFRSDKTECPQQVAPQEARDVLTNSIAASILAGWVSEVLDGDHPKYVWGRSVFKTTVGQPLEVVWEACSSNRSQWWYHAYPIQPDRHSDTMPEDVEDMLWPEA
ncbi:MAG: hypothetical protein H6834_11330 [Planctomycetes bacterium]|nr:hypothetical protein [Planctomycetota bacterium]